MAIVRFGKVKPKHPRKRTPPKLSPQAKFLIDDFDEDARDFGLKQEWGVGKEAGNAETLYNASKKALEEFVTRLQEKIRKLKEKGNIFGS